jgi:hypothetical protein
MAAQWSISNTPDVGMNNEGLLTSMRNSVKGSEPCVLHILNILTKTDAASQQLTDVVNYLYRSRQVYILVIESVPMIELTDPSVGCCL